MGEAQEVDVNDPETWPEDMDELAKLADDMPDDRAGIEKPEETPAEEETPKAEEKPDTSAEGGDKPTGEPEAKADDDPDGVMAKDGKNVLPFGVLQKEREKSHAQAERIAELEKAVAASIKEGEEAGDDEPGKAEDKTPAAAPPENDDDKEIAKLEVARSKIMEEYGDENLVAVIDSRIHEIKAKAKDLDGQVKREQSQEQTDIQDALDSSPTLSAWSSSEDQTFHNHATALNAYLLETDPAYRDKSWAERFEDLPGRVEALHGAAPKTKETHVVDIEKAKQDAAKVVPKSISDIKGGDAPAGTDLEELETMSASSITQKMMDFKSEDEMEAFVRGLS